MLLKDFIQASTALLAAGSETAQLDCQLLVMHVLKCDKTFLYREPHYELQQKELAAIEALLQRRKAGEPIAYIIGQQGFWDFEVKVTPDTLIPRPETECLVEYVLAHHDAHESLRVLDLGTGSGAIVLALQKERPQWLITAIDKSEAALEIAKQNAIALGLQQICFLHSDWFSAIADECFDLIISNPPYIDPIDPAVVSLRFEPQTALTAEESGYADLKHIIKNAPNFLSTQGELILEHGADQQQFLYDFLKNNGFISIQKGVDYAGLPRFLVSKCT